jgi:hypothetical protein
MVGQDQVIRSKHFVCFGPFVVKKEPKPDETIIYKTFDNQLTS